LTALQKSSNLLTSSNQNAATHEKIILSQNQEILQLREEILTLHTGTRNLAQTIKEKEYWVKLQLEEENLKKRKRN